MFCFTDEFRMLASLCIGNLVVWLTFFLPMTDGIVHAFAGTNIAVFVYAFLAAHGATMPSDNPVAMFLSLLSIIGTLLAIISYSKAYFVVLLMGGMALPTWLSLRASIIEWAFHAEGVRVSDVQVIIMTIVVASLLGLVVFAIMRNLYVRMIAFVIYNLFYTVVAAFSAHFLWTQHIASAEPICCSFGNTNDLPVDSPCPVDLAWYIIAAIGLFTCARSAFLLRFWRPEWYQVYLDRKELHHLQQQQSPPPPPQQQPATIAPVRMRASKYDSEEERLHLLATPSYVTHRFD